MIIAGIDEAGYGPLLGPLTVGCCAFQVDVDPAQADLVDAVVPTAGGGAAVAEVAALPCVWTRLMRYVGKTRSKSGKKIHVNDSKLVYSPSNGLKELERSVLALCAASSPAGECPTTLDGLLARVAPYCRPELAEHPWYLPAADEPFPCEQDALPIKLFAKSLRAEMAAKGARCVYLAARVMSERPYNRMINLTQNKASVLFTQSSTHLDHVVRTFSADDLHVFCDRQGGRSSYGGQLRLLFEDWRLEILHEADARSDYALHRGGRTVRVTWAEKAEAQCLPVAAASMVAKYLREAIMRRFNAYWRQHAPDVAPTAGYYTDGLRFLGEIAEARRRLGVRDEDLIRAR